MANRRTISKALVSSLQFISMSKAAQALYLHIILNADDDGICEAGLVLRVTNTRKTALSELVNGGYVTIIEPVNNIVAISEWQSFVTVEPRYGHPSRYRQTMLEHFPNHKFVDFKRSGGNSHASDTRERQVKTSEEKRKEVKLSQVPEASETEQTNNTNDFYGIPTKAEVKEYLLQTVFSGGQAELEAEKQAERFIAFNSSDSIHWGWIRETPFEEMLERFIQKDGKMQLLRKQKASAQHLLNEARFEEAADMYKDIHSIKPNSMTDEEIAIALIEEYGLPSEEGFDKLEDDHLCHLGYQ